MTFNFSQYVTLIASVFLSAVFLLFPSSAIALNVDEAVFAGGCFWCLEHDFEGLSGVVSVESGYSGGTLQNPTYKQVSSGGTGHKESVNVLFDANEISYKDLLRTYWRNVDAIDGDGQFCDRGDSYQPVIFTRDKIQLAQANESFIAAAKELNLSLEDLKVEIKSFEKFWPAEDYHQNFAEENQLKYNFYRYSCGRDDRLNALWGKKARTDSDWSENI